MRLLLLLALACRTPADTDTDTDVPVVDADGDGSPAADDCDDDAADVHPGGVETCDGRDEDCDGVADDGDHTFYADDDGDGYGGAAVGTVCDAPPDGTIATDGDCDDTTGTVHPGAIDGCGDGVDEDCADGDAICPTSTSVASADVTFVGTTGDALGVALAAGDVTGDGVLDVAASAWEADGKAGVVYVHDGATGEGTSLTAGGDGGLGLYLALGDVTGDGVGDVVATWGELAKSRGSAAVFAGPISAASAASAPVALVDGSGDGAVAIGDLDGDGDGDLLASAGMSGGGEMAIFAGPLQGDVAPADALATYAGDGGIFGNGVAVGDLDGDGVDDVAIGAPLYAADGADGADGSESFAGGAWVFLGPRVGAVAAADADFVATGDANWDLGFAMTAADLDGDGRDDLLVAATGLDTTGGALAYAGPWAGADDAGAGAWATFLGDQPHELAGTAVAAGDVDLDGSADVLLAAPYHDGDDYDDGVVALWTSPDPGVHPATSADRWYAGDEALMHTGQAVAVGADRDSDGDGDLWVGAADDDRGGKNAGVVFVF